MAAGPDDDQVGTLLGGDLRDRSGRTADHHVAHLNRCLDPLLGQLLRLLADRRLDLGFVRMYVTAGLARDSLVDMNQHQPGAVAQRQLGSYRDRSA